MTAELPFLPRSVIVSCQAQPDSPFAGPAGMTLMARAAALGGAAGIRANGPDDIAAISAAVDLPIIGISKTGRPDGVYITPTFASAAAVVRAGARLVALDATDRSRPDGVTVTKLIARIHDELGVLVMADVDDLPSGVAAAAAGADLIASTLSGYTPSTADRMIGPDLELVRRLVAAVPQPVVAEGRYSRPDDVERAFEAGATAVVVGTAVTNPTAITRSFVAGSRGASAMRIGAAAATIAVPAGTALGGYADRTEAASGTLDDLQLWCITVHSGATTLAIVVVDLVCVNEDLARVVAAAVEPLLPGDDPQVWTLATHTHSGPDQNCGTGDRATPSHWLQLLPSIAADAAAQALATAQTASITLRTGTLHDIGAVRATTDAPPQVPFDLVTVVDAESQLRGVLAVVPVHPTVLPAASSLISGDLAASIRRALTVRLARSDAAPWVVVATGCAGDISTRTTRLAQTPDECARLGESAAAQLETILAAPPVLTVPAGAPVAAARCTLQLSVRDTEAVTEPRRGTGSAVEQRIAHTLEQGVAVARERDRRFPDGVAALVVSAARIGDLRLAGIGAEPYLAVRELPSGPGIVLGYANGYAGYLPDADGFSRVTYESLSSPFRPDAAAKAVDAIEELFTKLNREDST